MVYMFYLFYFPLAKILSKLLLNVYYNMYIVYTYTVYTFIYVDKCAYNIADASVDIYMRICMMFVLGMQEVKGA